MSNQEKVFEFHKYFGQPARRQPTLISGDEVHLRRSLLSEEAAEADEAMEHGVDLQHIAKELADVLFVAYGAAVHYGIDLDRTFDAVAKSNMSKLWDCDKCDGTGLDESFGCSACEATGKIKKLRFDGKVIKPPTYEQADLSFIPKQQRTSTFANV